MPVDAWQRPRHWPKYPGTNERIEIGSDIVSAGIHRPSNTVWVVHQSARPDSLPTITLLGSKDEGHSWTHSPVFPETEVGWRPTLAVEAHGALAVTWFKPDSLRTNDQPMTHPTALELGWLRPSEGGGASLLSRQVIDRFDWTPRRNGTWFLGDYHGLTVTRDAALAVYSHPTSNGIRVCAVRVPIPPLSKITGVRDSFWPEVSPDGTQLLYLSPKRSGPIHLMNSDGSNARLLASGTDVAWFPDGQHVLAVQRSEKHARLVVIPLNGAAPDTLPGLYPKLLWRPRPSPDGKSILFGILGIESQPAVFHLVGRDGSKIRDLHPSAKGECLGPVWSHDGRIAFVSIESDSTGNAQSTTLYTMDADGGNEKALATLPGGAQWISWSPHDQFLALQDDIPNGPGEIVIVATASGHVYRISHSGRPYLDETPSWSSDGWIYFQSNREGSFALYRMRSDGSQQQRVGQP